MGLKSIFDGLYVDQLIQKNERGEYTLYPHGLMGRGYVLPAEREPAMRRRVRTTMLISLAVGIALGMFIVRVVDSANAATPLGWVITVGIGVLAIDGLILNQRRLATGLNPVAGPRPSLGEWLRAGRRSRPAWTYRFSAIAGLLLLLMAVAAIGVGMSDNDYFVVGCGVFLVLVSVLGAWDGVLGLKERSRG